MDIVFTLILFIVCFVFQKQVMQNQRSVANQNLLKTLHQNKLGSISGSVNQLVPQSSQGIFSCSNSSPVFAPRAPLVPHNHQSVALNPLELGLPQRMSLPHAQTSAETTLVSLNIHNEQAAAVGSSSYSFPARPFSLPQVGNSDQTPFVESPNIQNQQAAVAGTHSPLDIGHAPQSDLPMVQSSEQATPVVPSNNNTEQAAAVLGALNLNQGRDPYEKIRHLEEQLKLKDERIRQLETVHVDSDSVQTLITEVKNIKDRLGNIENIVSIGDHCKLTVSCRDYVQAWVNTLNENVCPDLF